MSLHIPRPRTAVGGELVLPVLAVGFTIYFFVSVWDLSWEAKANAVLIGIALLVLVALLLVRLVRQIVAGEADFKIGRLLEPREVLGQRAAVVGLSALFIGAIPYLGLTLGLFLLVATLMVILKAGTWRAILATSAIVAVTAYLLFIALLNSRLPRGPVEKALAFLVGGN
jgi:hypothetical protein